MQGDDDFLDCLFGRCAYEAALLFMGRVCWFEDIAVMPTVLQTWLLEGTSSWP
jgi:hypothetical protein